MSVLVRAGTEKDLPVLCRMGRDFVDEHCCNGMVYASLEEWRGYEHVMVAELDGRVIGYSYGRVDKSHMRKAGVWERGDDYYDIEELYVQPEYRNAGVGRMLFDAQEQIARGLNCASIQLAAVSRDHRRLLAFYESAGMEFWSAWMIKSLR